jgi:hypothetical protein
LPSVKEYLEYSKLKVKTLDNFCTEIITNKHSDPERYKNLFQYFYKTFSIFHTEDIIAGWLGDFKKIDQGLKEKRIVITVAEYKWFLWGTIDQLKTLDNRLDELLIIHKHLILIDRSDENVKELKFKAEGLDFKRAEIELQKMKLSLNEIRKLTLEMKKNPERNK